MAARGTPPREPGRLTVLAGPTAVGKGTVAADVRAHYPEVWLSVSATTRRRGPARSTACTTTSSTTASSTGWSRRASCSSGPSCTAGTGTAPRGVRSSEPSRRRAPALLEIDLQGARQVRDAMPEALFVFLAPPSWEELVRRLVGRGTEAEEERERRLDTARVELAAEHEFDT